MKTKKGYVEFSMTTIMVIIIGVAVLVLGLFLINKSTYSEQNFCENNPEKCNFIIEDKVSFENELDVYSFLEENKYVSCLWKESDFKREAYYQRGHWEKKNECQLYLEENWILGENCICEEEKKPKKELQLTFSTTGSCSTNYKIAEPITYEEVKKRQEKEYNSITKEFYDSFDEVLITEISSTDCNIKYTLISSEEKQAVCVKAKEKVLEDYSCNELDKLYKCKQKESFKPNIKECAGFYFIDEKVDILKIYGDKGCFE